MKRNAVNMLEGPILPNIIKYTVPIILTGILQLLFNSADLIVVGQFCGSISVAAVGATSHLIHLMVNFFIGISVGVGVCVANGTGSSNKKFVFQTVHTAIPCAAVCGLFLSFVGFFFARKFLLAMGTPDDVIDLSTAYMQIYFCGTVPNLIYNFGSAILRAVGETKAPLYYLTSAGILNVILNILFVTVFKMDVAGVALATILSQFLSAALMLINLIKRDDDCRLILTKMRFYGQPIIRIIKIGLPAGLQASLFSISNILIQSSVNSFGSVVMSGNAAASNLEGFVYTSMNSFQQTSTNFVGQNLGAGNYKRIKKITAVCLLCVSMTGIILGMGFYLAGRPLLSIYITDSEEAIKYGIERMAFVCIPYFIIGLLDVMTGVLRGLDYSFVPMVITVIGVCGMRIGWIFSIFRMEKFHSLSGLMVSYPISWTVTFFALLISYFIVKKKRMCEKFIF